MRQRPGAPNPAGHRPPTTLKLHTRIHVLVKRFSCHILNEKAGLTGQSAAVAIISWNNKKKKRHTPSVFWDKKETGETSCGKIHWREWQLQLTRTTRTARHRLWIIGNVSADYWNLGLIHQERQESVYGVRVYKEKGRQKMSSEFSDMTDYCHQITPSSTIWNNIFFFF